MVSNSQSRYYYRPSMFLNSECDVWTAIQCRNIRNLWLEHSGVYGSKTDERALFHSFSATRQPPSATDAVTEPMCGIRPQMIEHADRIGNQLIGLHRTMKSRSRPRRQRCAVQRAALFGSGARISVIFDQVRDAVRTGVDATRRATTVLMAAPRGRRVRSEPARRPQGRPVA